MLEKHQNLFKSVIRHSSPITEWVDEVYLADACKERFLTLTEIPEWSASDIRMAGLAELYDGYHVERPKVEVHTLLFTLEGGGRLITPEFTQDIAPYTLTVIPAQTSFRFEMHPELKQWKMIWLLLEPSTKWEHVIEFGQRVMPFQSCEQVWSLMSLLWGEIGGRVGFRRLIVSEVQRMLSDVDVPISDSLSRVQALFNEVESQLHLPWTVSQMAKQCYISEEQFNRLTKQLFGMSPRNRLIQLRMEKAADLLNNQGWSIAMIANRLGYQDPYNFTHRFRKYYGTPPTKYRKKIRENALARDN